MRPVALFRRWKRAAGPVFGRFVPAAPFSAMALVNSGPPPLQTLLYDETCRKLATALLQTLEGEAVQAGEAALIIDLPGPVSLGLGFHLQAAISPVLLFGGLWQPNAVLNGQESGAALARYGENLSQSQNVVKPAWAFLLERERFDEVPPLKLIDTLDNRYRAGLGLMPPLLELGQAGLGGLIDLRLVGDNIPEDLAEFYEIASQAGLDVFQTVINQEA